MQSIHVLAFLFLGALLDPGTAMALDSKVLSSCTSGPPQAQCGVLEVAENHDHPQGRTIGIHVMVIPATGQDRAKDPLFVLGGGPGQPVSLLANPLATLLAPLNQQRDIVLVDQRGTGASAPFRCALGDGEDPTRKGFAFSSTRLKRCLADTQADPRFYGTADFVKDLDLVRDWLGYDRINISGGSYGAWAALSYAHHYPDRVRTVAVQSVVTPDAGFPAFLARSFDRALDRLSVRCLAEPACRAAYGNVASKASQVMTQLQERGHKTGELTSDGFANAIATRLYVPQFSASVPQLIHAAWQGRVDAALLETPRLGAGISWGLFLSVTCAEGIGALDADRIHWETRGTLTGDGYLSNLRSACSHWPHRPTPPLEIELNGLPVLLLSGSEDPAAPPDLAERAARWSTAALHVELPYQAHTPFQPQCALQLITEFVVSGNGENLDLSCTRDLRPVLFDIADQDDPVDEPSDTLAKPSGSGGFVGRWQGKIRLSSVGGSDMDIGVHISQSADGYSARLSSSSSTVSNPDFTHTELLEGGKVVLIKPTSGGELRLEGKIKGDRIRGTMRQGRLRAPFYLDRVEG